MSGRGAQPRREWQPLQRAVVNPEVIEAVTDTGRDPSRLTVWLNDRYQVFRQEFESEAFGQTMVHLSIKRVDKKPVHDWRHLQQIKNELVGAECEGIELYPASSRLLDEANQFHLWCFVDPSTRVPVGTQSRCVGEASEARTRDGRVRQRAFEEGLTL